MAEILQDEPTFVPYQAPAPEPVAVRDSPIVPGLVVTDLVATGWLAVPGDHMDRIGQELPPPWAGQWVTIVAAQPGVQNVLGEQQPVTRLGYVVGQRASELARA